MPKVSLREFHQKRNKVLIVRNARGIGDILAHRMIFEDFKRIMPDMYLVFACPEAYHCLVKDHPFVDEAVDSVKMNRFNYLISYDTTTCDIKYECLEKPYATKSRPDVWAEHCGVKLENHNMHVPFIPNELIQSGVLQVHQLRGTTRKIYHKDAPSIFFCPFAFDKLRTLTDEQMAQTIEFMRKKGYFVYSAYYKSHPVFDELNVPLLTGRSIPEWLSLIQAADYVVSVDTATFHYAGGIGKPLTGIFTHADGKLRGMYYDFILVQKHRDNGDWPCGPCYNHLKCTHSKCKKPLALNEPKPCLTELTIKDITDGIEKMLEKWPIRR